MAHYFKLGIFEDASSMYDVVYATDPWKGAKMSIDKITNESPTADVWSSYLPPVPPPRVDYDTKSNLKVDYLGEIQHLRELLKAGQHLCTIQNDTIAMLCARLDSMQEGLLYLWQGMWQPMAPNTQYIIIESKGQASLEKDGQDDALPKSQALESVDFVRAFPGITSMKKYCFRRQDSKLTGLSGEPRFGSSHSVSRSLNKEETPFRKHEDEVGYRDRLEKKMNDMNLGRVDYRFNQDAPFRFLCMVCSSLYDGIELCRTCGENEVFDMHKCHCGGMGLCAICKGNNSSESCLDYVGHEGDAYLQDMGSSEGYVCMECGTTYENQVPKCYNCGCEDIISLSDVSSSESEENDAV